MDLTSYPVILTPTLFLEREDNNYQQLALLDMPTTAQSHHDGVFYLNHGPTRMRLQWSELMWDNTVFYNHEEYLDSCDIHIGDRIGITDISFSVQGVSDPAASWYSFPRPSPEVARIFLDSHVDLTSIIASDIIVPAHGRRVTLSLSIRSGGFVDLNYLYSQASANRHITRKFFKGLESVLQKDIVYDFVRPYKVDRQARMTLAAPGFDVSSTTTGLVTSRSIDVTIHEFYDDDSPVSSYGSL